MRIGVPSPTYRDKKGIVMSKKKKSQDGEFFERHPWVLLLGYFPLIYPFGVAVSFGAMLVISLTGIEPSFKKMFIWPTELYRAQKEW